MPKWLSRSLLIGGTFILVWLVVMYSWHTSNRMPDIPDVVLYFIALPVALLAASWGMSKAWAASKKKTDNAAPAVPETAGEEQNPVQDLTAERERELTIAILASAIRTAQGSSNDEFISKWKSNEAKIDLDQALTDSNGYPILAGRIQEVDEDMQRELLAEWGAANGQADVEWTSAQLRAIALGSEVVEELAQPLISHTQLESYRNAKPGRRDTSPLPVLKLISILPRIGRKKITSC